jgi:hypothetical protein
MSDIQTAFDGLKRKHEALISSMITIQEENKLLKGINIILVEEKKQWLEQKNHQDRMLQQQLQINDNIVRNLQDEIISLKKRYR